jgi:2-amino-4-hydroxy-6-hydroxymethyldihydropteridine diphosphokinase
MQGTAHTVSLALGTNLGNRQANLKSALQHLSKSVTLQRISSLYETDPVGYEDQPRFLNITCYGTTQLAPQALLDRAKEIEKAMGRQQTIRNGPRPIDIDILLYDRLTLTQERLTIPHPRMRERAFVLVPLQEISPTSVDPVTGQTIQQLAQAISHAGVTKIATHW